MTGTPEPFIVYAGTDRLTRLADVLITRSDGRPPYAQIAALFAEYPGLTLALILVADRRAVAGTRDGAITSLPLVPAAPIQVMAAALYEDWLESSARMTSARGDPNSS